MVLEQCLLANIAWSLFIPYSVAEVLGGVVGSVIVWIMYADHFKASTDEISPITIRNLFCTAPAVRNLPRNFFVELFDTFIFISSILAISEIKTPGIVPIGVGLLVWAIGMGLGGPTGFAMNLARDMGPLIAHAILPIANKADSDWQIVIGNTVSLCQELRPLSGQQLPLGLCMDFLELIKLNRRRVLLWQH